jgi:D-aspartate ligase
MHIPSNSTDTPVLVFPSSDHGPLGITRSLGRLGVPIYNADFNNWPVSFCSTYSRRRFCLSGNYECPPRLANALLECADAIGARSILLPTTDEAAIFVAEQSGRLREHFIFPELPGDLASSLCSKKQMYFLARKYETPTAETCFPQCRRDVIEFLDTATFPIMLKAIDGTRLWKRVGKKMFIVNSKRELLELYDLAEDLANPNLMIQEYIPGGDDAVWMFNGYFNAHSECLLGFTGKKIRQCPINTGSTSLGVCMKNDHVEQTTLRFMRQIGYKGILDIGYRYDLRDGLYKVLDINPRIGATFRLFVGEAGMDVARAMYCDLTTGSVPPDSAREGRRWIVEDLDLVSTMRYFARGDLTFKQWWKSLVGIEEFGYFAMDDLLPLLPLLFIRTAELFRRIYRRVHRHCRPASFSVIKTIKIRIR